MPLYCLEFVSQIDRPTVIIGIGVGSMIGSAVGYFRNEQAPFEESVFNIYKGIILGGLSGALTACNPGIIMMLGGCVLYDNFICDNSKSNNNRQSISQSDSSCKSYNYLYSQHVNTKPVVRNECDKISYFEDNEL